MSLTALPLHLPLPSYPELRLQGLHQSLHANAVLFPPLCPTHQLFCSWGVGNAPPVWACSLLGAALRQGDKEKLGSIQHNTGE